MLILLALLKKKIIHALQLPLSHYFCLLFKHALLSATLMVQFWFICDNFCGLIFAFYLFSSSVCGPNSVNPFTSLPVCFYHILLASFCSLFSRILCFNFSKDAFKYLSSLYLRVVFCSFFGPNEERQIIYFADWYP